MYVFLICTDFAYFLLNLFFFYCKCGILFHYNFQLVIVCTYKSCLLFTIIILSHLKILLCIHVSKFKICKYYNLFHICIYNIHLIISSLIVLACTFRTMLIKSVVRACVGNTYAKTGAIPRGLAWPLSKDGTEICDTFCILSPQPQDTKAKIKNGTISTKQLCTAKETIKKTKVSLLNERRYL